VHKLGAQKKIIKERKVNSQQIERFVWPNASFVAHTPRGPAFFGPL